MSTFTDVQNFKLKADARAEHKQMAHDKRQTFQQKVSFLFVGWLVCGNLRSKDVQYALLML